MYGSSDHLIPWVNDLWKRKILVTPSWFMLIQSLVLCGMNSSVGLISSQIMQHFTGIFGILLKLNKSYHISSEQIQKLVNIHISPTLCKWRTLKFACFPLDTLLVICVCDPFWWRHHYPSIFEARASLYMICGYISNNFLYLETSWA